MKKLTAVFGLLVAAVASVGLVAPGTALATVPVVTGVASCNDDGSWTVVWTVTPDKLPADTITWEILDPSGYSPAGTQSADEVFTRTATYPATETSVNERVKARWSNGAQATRGATVTRPSGCATAPTTTTPDEGSPTTTPGEGSSTTTTPDEVAPTTTVPDEVSPTTTPGEGSPPGDDVDAW